MTGHAARREAWKRKKKQGNTKEGTNGCARNEDGRGGGKGNKGGDPREPGNWNRRCRPRAIKSSRGACRSPEGHLTTCEDISVAQCHVDAAQEASGTIPVAESCACPAGALRAKLPGSAARRRHSTHSSPCPSPYLAPSHRALALMMTRRFFCCGRQLSGPVARVPVQLRNSLTL